jgi:Family of unknown function (DUF6884)
LSDASSILVLSTCTATKATGDTDRAMPAEDLYAGQQHRRLMRGVKSYRAAGQPAGPLELHIISAGHGVVAAHEPLHSYDESFTGMGQAQLRRHASRLRVPQAVSGLLAQRRRLAVLLLGEDYLRAAQLGSEKDLGAPTLVFTSPGAATRLPTLASLHPIALDNRDARRFSCGLVALKGELAARLLIGLADTPAAWMPLDREGLLRWLEDIQPPAAVRPPSRGLAEVA